jgi:hypothetical protein
VAEELGSDASPNSARAHPTQTNRLTAVDREPTWPNSGLAHLQILAAQRRTGIGFACPTTLLPPLIDQVLESLAELFEQLLHVDTVAVLDPL